MSNPESDKIITSEATSGERYFHSNSTLPDAAQAAGIAKHRIENPFVRELLTFINAAGQLQAGTAVAASSTERVYLPGTDRTTGRSHQELDSQRQLLGAAPLQESLARRYASTELLMRGVLAILGKDLDFPADQQRFKTYLASVVDRAIAPYGLTVTDKPQKR